jgi:hypothetical protein
MFELCLAPLHGFVLSAVNDQVPITNLMQQGVEKVEMLGRGLSND